MIPLLLALLLQEEAKVPFENPPFGKAHVLFESHETRLSLATGWLILPEARTNLETRASIFMPPGEFRDFSLEADEPRISTSELRLALDFEPFGVSLAFSSWEEDETETIAPDPARPIDVSYRLSWQSLSLSIGRDLLRMSHGPFSAGVRAEAGIAYLRQELSNVSASDGSTWSDDNSARFTALLRARVFGRIEIAPGWSLGLDAGALAYPGHAFGGSAAAFVDVSF